MRAFILMAAAMCCHGAPQMTVPVAYMSNSLSLTSPAVLPYSSAVLSPSAEVPALPLALSALQYRAQDEFGAVTFQHLGGPNFRSEYRTPFGAQVGGFSYIDGAGKVQHRTYVADIFGNRVAGTDLPVAPEETAEVAEQRAALSELKSTERRRRSAMLRFTTPITHSVATNTFSVPATSYTTVPVVSRPIKSEAIAKTAATKIPEALKPIPVVEEPTAQPALKAEEAPKPALKAEDPKPALSVEDLTKPVAETKAETKSIKIEEPTAPVLKATEIIVEADDSVEFDADSVEDLKPILKPQEPVKPLIKSVEPTPVKSVEPAAPTPAKPLKAAEPAPTPILAPAPEPAPAPAPIVVKAAPIQPVAAVAVAAPAPAITVAELPTPLQAPNPPAPSPEVPYQGGKFHSQDELGQYSFGHFGGSHSRLENKDYLGHTRGSFAYRNSEGEIHVRKYAAGIGVGFTVAGSDLPVDTNKPVDYTPEVIKARNAHLALRQKEVEAKKTLESSEPAPGPAEA